MRVNTVRAEIARSRLPSEYSDLDADGKEAEITDALGDLLHLAASEGLEVEAIRDCAWKQAPKESDPDD